MKYDAVATLDAGRVTLTTRGGKDWTAQFPTIADALGRLRVTNAVLDGEYAHVLDDGRTDFQNLQNALKILTRSGAARVLRLRPAALRRR